MLEREQRAPQVSEPWPERVSMVPWQMSRRQQEEVWADCVRRTVSNAIWDQMHT